VPEQAGILRRVVQGRQHHLSVTSEPLEEARAWFKRHRVMWEEAFDAVEEHLDETS
jgi:hypothetical protein